MTTAVLEKQESKSKVEQKRTYRPPIAIYENTDSYAVLIELPGADEKTVQLRFDNGVLTVEASVKVELPSGATARYSEMNIGDYRRTLNLGDQVDEEKIEATFKSGLLTVTLPKSKHAQARKIQIKTA